MFFIGLIYASLSLILVHWFFSQDPDLSKASGMMVVIFLIMFSLPYMYFIIKKEEKEDETVEGFKGVWNAHKDALYAFMWLFLGFVIAFSFWYIVLQDANLLNFQLQTYCRINNPTDINACVEQYIMGPDKVSGAVLKETRLLSIIENNVYVMIFTLIFSLIFGAGALAVIMFIWAGLIYITNPSKGDDAKAKLIWGTVGLVVALISYALVQLIAQFSRSGTLQ